MKFYRLSDTKEIIEYDNMNSYIYAGKDDETNKNIVKQDVINGYYISTVLLSTGFFPFYEHRFETMIFIHNTFQEAGYKAQYTTYADALEAHNALVRCFEEGMIIQN